MGDLRLTSKRGHDGGAWPLSEAAAQQVIRGANGIGFASRLFHLVGFEMRGLSRPGSPVVGWWKGCAFLPSVVPVRRSWVGA